MLTKKKIIDFLKEYKKKKKDIYHFKKIGIFGSYIKDDKRKKNDLDIVVEFSKPNIFNQAAIMQEIKDKLQIDVDVISLSKYTNPKLLDRINKEAIYV